ncbi:flavoprotein oxygenase [Stachybotrys elegans]|uniref:Flavoprotein oxygenase n=1 Tax=Stachybotrys elegans TaxID=80388 RepID=A0A8K0WKY0_9HYPO|nr:flavoprotein oxygenase [Stachybotrys elegans]
MDNIRSLPIEAFDKESLVNRNPHKDFDSVQSQRPDYPLNHTSTYTKSPHPGWKIGDGANSNHWKNEEFISIDPAEEGRPEVLNYKLMISTTVPRPVALVSTITADGKTRNLAPFSYFQCVIADPPLYSLAFAGEHPNDTLRNILDTGELCISMTSDWIIEAANFTSINTPPHISEWNLAGLTPAASAVVKPPFVAESPYSAECKLHSHQEISSKRTGRRTATLVLVEIVRFHIWRQALAEDMATADLSKLRPVFRAGGTTYGTVQSAFEIPRPPPFRNLVQSDAVNTLRNNS